MKRISLIISTILAILFSGWLIAQTPYTKPDDATLRRKLSPIQYAVTQKKETEPPFKNAYWNNEKPGIYVDVVTGEPLFSSLDKFDSGTGWPSFTKPISPDSVILQEDHAGFLPVLK